MNNLQVLDAVETLSQLSQVSDKSHPELIPQPERIKKAFQTIHGYLSDLYDQKQMLLKNHDYLASLKAVMVIAEEAYDKLDFVSKIFKTDKNELGEPEFKHLFDFYLKKINYKVEHIAGEVFRHAQEEKQRALSDSHGLKNLEVIRKDSEYELFIIKDEDGLNHFSKNLLRHTQLLGTFDELFLGFQGEDPFIKLKYVDDRLKQKRALSVRSDLAPRVDYFLKEAFRFKKQPFIAASCSMMYALFLASYPSVALQNDPYKACFEYFDDLLMFLTNLVTKSEFFRTGSSMELISDKGILASQRFICGVITSLFLSKNDSRFIAEHLYQYVTRPQIETFSPISFFLKLLEFDQSLRRFLANFPSGPLMKALDFLKDPNKTSVFAPLRENLPQNLLNLTYLDKSLTCAVLGSPTMQNEVKSADIDPLFQVFLDQFEGQSTVIISFEDRFNPYHAARVSALNSLSSDKLIIVNLPRAGMFYQQHDVYAFIDNAQEFKKLVIDQFDDEENCVYSQSGLTQDEAQALFLMIHDKIFEKKEKLVLRERLIFIEIMHLLMVCKLVQNHEADNLFLICKDGIDHSNAICLSLQALVMLLNNENLLTRNVLDFYISALYGPSMTIRDRPILEDSLVRMCSAMSILHAHILKNPSFIKSFHTQFPALKSLKIK